MLPVLNGINTKHMQRLLATKLNRKLAPSLLSLANIQGLSWADTGPARGWAGLGQAGPGGLARPIIFFTTGRDPAGPIKFMCGGPRPGPVRQFFRDGPGARPGPKIIQWMGRGPAQPITF